MSVMSGRDGRLSDSAAKLDQRMLKSDVGTQEQVYYRGGYMVDISPRQVIAF